MQRAAAAGCVCWDSFDCPRGVCDQAACVPPLRFSLAHSLLSHKGCRSRAILTEFDGLSSHTSHVHSLPARLPSLLAPTPSRGAAFALIYAPPPAFPSRQLPSLCLQSALMPSTHPFVYPSPICAAPCTPHTHRPVQESYLPVHAAVAPMLRGLALCNALHVAQRAQRASELAQGGPVAWLARGEVLDGSWPEQARVLLSAQRAVLEPGLSWTSCWRRRYAALRCTVLCRAVLALLGALGTVSPALASVMQAGGFVACVCWAAAQTTHIARQCAAMLLV